MARRPVRLNVYDMYWLNDYASNLGVGIFHTGIEVYGIEYAYGGHPFAFSGVFENSPQDAEELGENFKFRESILLGETDFSQKDVRDLVKGLGEEFRGDRYHLIMRNCNHFSDRLAKTLTGNEIPGWINRLASISSSIPFLERMLPQEWLTPVALQQSIDDRRASNGARLAANRPSLDTSVEEATEATTSLGHNDSRITVLNGRTMNGDRVGASPSAPSSAASSTGSSSAAPSTPASASLNRTSMEPVEEQREFGGGRASETLSTAKAVSSSSVEK